MVIRTQTHMVIHNNYFFKEQLTGYYMEQRDSSRATILCAMSRLLAWDNGAN